MSTVTLPCYPRGRVYIEYTWVCIKFKPSVYAGFNKSGGESGIRTHVTLSSKHAFQACAFSHSAISPRKRTVLMTKNYVGSCCRCLDFMVQRWEAQQQQTAVSTQHSANSLNDGWALITRCDPL